MSFTYEYYKVCADYIRERAPFEPEIGLILGTGLGPFASQIENPVSIPYRDIPNFLVSTAPGHAGKLIFGTISGKKVVCMAGRFHSYEGYSFEQLSIPVRVLKLLGIRKLILTNAAGAVNESYHPGDIMILNDHLKLTGDSPMKGPNIPEFGDRFFDISRMYTPELRKIAKECAKDTGLHIHEGVYMFFNPCCKTFGGRCGRNVHGDRIPDGCALRFTGIGDVRYHQHGRRYHQRRALPGRSRKSR